MLWNTRHSLVSLRMTGVSSTVPVTDFTPAERELIRPEFGMHFGGYPPVADGIFLRL